MIIDSHAHYNNRAYSGTFRYLTHAGDGYALREGDLGQLFGEMSAAGIPCSIEPGVTLQSCEEILQLCAGHPGRLFPAVGVHPTRTFLEKWQDRKKLILYANDPAVVAIGECGLDYHHPRKQQHRLTQHLWFLYQLNLAWKLKKPVILHVRNAHEDALRILRQHPARRLGGVVHCFCASYEIARQYLELGYHIGIGGSLLQQEERSKELCEAVRQMSLERILLETDAPYILPYCKDTLPPKQLRRARNTSLILPAIAERIAELKGVSPESVAQQTAENAIRLFGLESKPPAKPEA